MVFEVYSGEDDGELHEEPWEDELVEFAEDKGDFLPEKNISKTKN